MNEQNGVTIKMTDLSNEALKELEWHFRDELMKNNIPEEDKAFFRQLANTITEYLIGNRFNDDIDAYDKFIQRLKK
jgi:hypothetical protein